MDSQAEFKKQKNRALDMLSNVFGKDVAVEAEEGKSKEDLEKQAKAALEKLLGDCKTAEDAKKVVERMVALCKENDAAIQEKAKKDKKKGTLLLKAWKALRTVLGFMLKSTADFLWKRIKGVVSTATAIVCLIGALWLWNPKLVETVYDFLVKVAETAEQAHKDGKEGAKAAGEKVLPTAKKVQKAVDKVDNDASSGAKGAGSAALKWLKK